MLILKEALQNPHASFHPKLGRPASLDFLQRYPDICFEIRLSW
ncbi:MAG: hypothetical protein RLZZ123_1621, partial [Pseudomonadota bacterium]